MPKKKGSKQPLTLDNIDKLDRATRERIYARIRAEEAVDRARALESRGWRPWYAEMFGADFVEALAPHHAEGIEWHWNATVLKKAGLDITEYAYFAIWSRGHMKSTIARYIAVADACLNTTGYCLYVSGSKNKVRGHAISIESLLGSPKILEYYPKLQTVREGLAGQSKGWTRDFIYTEAGYVFHFISLDEGVAGANVDSIRPTLIIPDDVDDREASPVISENRMRVLTRAVLPTRQHNTLVFWAQNLINRHTVLYSIWTGKQRVLTARVNTQPIPAFIDLRVELQTINGIPRDIIVGGTPTWPLWDIKRAQEEIDNIGLESFLAECQHDVDQDRAEAVVPEYDDVAHPITWEEFNGLYRLPANNRDLPAHWKRYIGHDWGCFPMDTELLTKEGWKKHNEVQRGDKVAAYALSNDQVVWTPLLHKVYKKQQFLVELNNKSFRFQCTPDHYWITHDRRADETWAREKFSDVWPLEGECTRHKSLVVAAECHADAELPCTPGQAAVLGWLVTDGWINGKAYFCQKNYPAALIADLNDSGFEWKELQARKDNGTRNFSLGFESWKELQRVTGFQSKEDLPSIVTRLSPEARRRMRRAMFLAEGTNCKGTNPKFQQQRGPVMDAFQILATLDGVRLGRERPHASQWGASNRQPILKSRKIRRFHSRKVEGLHDVWCGVTAYETLVVRQRGQITVTGNSSGTEAGHANVVGFVGVAAANAPLPGTAFFYHFKSFPASTLAGFVARAVLNFVLAHCQTDPQKYIELALLDRGTADPSDILANKARERVIEELGQLEQYVMWHMSHEAKAVRDIYRMVYGLPFQPCNPGRDGGVAQLRHYFRTDYSQPHPFRVGYNGLSRMYLIVENEDQRTHPTDDGGMKLAREQLQEWRMRPATLTAQGFLDERPMKVSDDVGNMLMMIFTHFRLHAAPLTEAERISAAIPAHLRYDELLANSPYQRGLTPEQELAHLFALKEARKVVSRDVESFDEWGELERD